MPHALELLEALTKAPYGYDFFQALRLIECAHPEHARIGLSDRPRDDPVRLGQEPTMAFSPTTLAAVLPAKKERPPRLLVNFLGLLGPNGPMPLHITEYVRDRLRNSDDPTLARFLDMFHHRLLSLFYRAWSSAQPAVSLDRPAEDRFSEYVGSLFGLGMDAMRDRDALPDAAKLHYAGLLANQARSADGLRAILGDFLRLPVRIVQYVGHWLELPEEDYTRLSGRAGTAELGISTALGARVWSYQHKFRIVVGPLGYAGFERMLPGGAALRQLSAWVRNYAGDVPACDVQLILKKEEVPALALGRGPKLGWSTWLPGRKSDRDADQLVLRAV